MLSFDARKERILNTSHVVRLDDMEIYEVRDVESVGNVIFVETETNLLFQDLDVFTLSEAANMERAYSEILNTNFFAK
jgi:hypothetical protein|tara:strand:- start:55 stop:288 length:234 start_codon:yes stop_codon:yes gene_type:complete